MKKQSKTKKLRKDHERIERDTQDTHIRYPRPLGFTYLNQTLKKTKEGTEEWNKLRNLQINQCIKLYVNEGMHWMGKQIPINQLAIYLNIEPNTLLILMNKEVERISNFFDGNEGKRLARVTFLQGLKKSLEICALTEHQTKILLAQQGTEYVPFLTSEVNRSLANLINAQKPTHDLLKMLTEKQITNILINLDKQSETSGIHYLSPDEARVIIAESGPSLLGNPSAIAAKESELGQLPDVLARNQDLSTIGVRIPAKTLLPNK